jgi:hypothetical protein
MNAESAGHGAADRRLELAWRYHRQWSLAAKAARTNLDRWRGRNLALLVTGAFAGALAAQTWLPSGVTRLCAVVAALVLALAGFVQANALNADRTARWVRARAASEALKAEVYRYLVGVAPYGGADRGDVLDAQLAVIQNRANAQLLDQQSSRADEQQLPALRTVAQYVTDRAQDQADWHRGEARSHARRGRRLRGRQLAVTAAGAVLSAVAAAFPTWHVSAWTTALTTVAAAIGAQVAATQHQRIAETYAATTDQLDRLVAGFDAATATPERGARFVVDVERVLATQNGGWTDLLTTTRPPAAAAQPPAADAAPATG